MNERGRGPGRGKRPVPQIQETSSSGSDSDVAAEVTTKRKKNNVITSESSDDSSGSSVVRERTMKPRRKMPRVWSENESSSGESSDDASDESDSTSENDDDDVPRPCGRVRRRLESEDDSFSSNSDSGDESSESGHSSANSYESCNDTDEEAMVQAAIQESLAIVGQPSQSRKEIEDSPRNKSQTVVEGFASDSSDGQSEKCPICLISFSTQEIGSPETCDHSFCSVCIQEWAKNVNTCPVDRQPFTLILVRKHVNGKVIKKIPVQNREARDSQESDSDPTFCEVCGRSDREDRLLLCDGCDLGYHLECLDPPMENVPVEEWFCPDCASDQNLRLAEEVEMQEGELLELLEDVIRIHPRRSRLLPRTRQSERVRATIRSLHQEMQHQDNDEPALQQPSTSGIESVGADSGSVTSGRRRMTTASVSTVRKRKIVRRKTVRKRRKRRTAKTTKRKTVKRKTKVNKKSIAIKGSEAEESDENEEYTPKTKRRKRRKRKIRRRKKKISRRKTARTAVPRSVKGRLANQLGLCAPTRPGMSLPVVRSRAIASDIDLQRSRAGIPALHIYGPQNELEYFSSENEISEGGNVTVVARPHSFHTGTSRLLAKKKMLSAAALQSHTAVTSPKPIRSKTKLEGTAVASSSPVDLIGSILDSQTIWHSKTPSVTIKPDGSLEVNKDRGGTAVSNTQGTVVCDSVSDKNKTDNSLIRSDNRLSEVSGSSGSPIDLGSVSARTTQTPMYPGRGDSNRPPPNSGFHQFGGNRYSAPNYSNYQGGRDFSNFSSSASNFDANSSRAGYSNYLNSGLPPPLLRNTPVRFRVTPRYPIRRPQGPQRPQDTSKPEEKKIDQGNDRNQRHREEEVDDDDDDDDDDEEIDIYSDIEAGGGGSGGPSAGGSEQDETERSMETSYEALPPPPEPSALLMGFGEQLLSEEEPTSDSELVIDDNGPSSPQEQNEGPQIPESEKYDPAEPLADSDDDEPPVRPPVDDFSDDEIPLPPSPPILLPFPSSSNIINTTSNSNASYLHSPTYGETSFETDKVPSVADNGVVSKVVKEVIQERLRSSPAIIKIGTSSGSPARLTSVKEDDTEECPNFSIYSAASMDIARRTGQEENNAKGEEKGICKLSENETREEAYNKDIGNEKYNADDSDREFESESPVENKSSSLSKKDEWDSSDENDEEDIKIKNARHGTKVVKEEEDNVENSVDLTVEMKGKVSDSEKLDDIKGGGVEEKVDSTEEVDNSKKVEGASLVEDAEQVEDSEQVDDAEQIDDSDREESDQESESDREDDTDKRYSKESNIRKVNEAERVDNVAESDDIEKEDKAKKTRDSEKEEDEVGKYGLKEEIIMKKKEIEVERDPNCEGNTDEENDQEHKVDETVSEDSENSLHKIIENKDKSEQENENYEGKVSESHDNKQSKNEMVELSEDENENNVRVDNDKDATHGDAGNSFDKGASSSAVLNKSDSDGYDYRGEKDVHVNEYPDNLSDKFSVKGKSKIPNEEDNNETLSNANEECYSNDHRKTRIDDTFDSDDDSLIGGISSAILVPGANPPAPSGLEGLDTETISETEEAINFEDISQDGNGLSVDEDGEISSGKKKKKKRSKRNADCKTSRDISRDPNNTRERTPPEEGEIIDDRPKVHDSSKRERTLVEEKDNTDIDLEVAKIVDANFDVSKPKDDEKKKKKKEKRKSIEKSVDRPVFRSSSENRRRGSKEKSRRSEEKNISWKKPSKSTKERNYRESKSGKPEESSKDKDDECKDTLSKKKKKEKRKDMERYDVRKIVSDKRRRRKDEFGRDLSRDRTLSRSRSRSHRRSRERSRSPSKSRRLRSPARARRSRSRSRFRSRSRSHRRSRSKSKNRARRKSKDRSRRSRSKERTRARVSRSRSRGRRSRSRSRSHSRSKNKTRMRSRSRTPIKQRERKDRNERSHLNREAPRFHTRRSWSRTWTPSWSRSHSRSLSCSSFTRSRSPSVHHFNRSFSRSFSRSWSRERYERIPLEKTGALSSKAPKKLTVIVSNTKDSQKKEKKKKKEKKSKETLGNSEKRKKRKEKSPAPSKEVFTSGDNILVSVNFNKSKTTNKDIATSLPLLPKETNKRKRDDTFEAERDVGKKLRKEKNKDKNKTVTSEKVAPSPQAEKKGKKQLARGNKNARMAAILKQKPVAIIDLDQSPFREQTPSPRDLIVLSDSDDEERNKAGEHEEIVEALSVCRGMRPDSNSPQSPAKGVSANIVGSRSPETELKLMSAVSNYLNTSTGPKTPPEPQIKFSIATKQPQLRSINNPLQEEDDILQEDAGLDDSDQRIEEELDRSLGDVVHKGPNTPPEPRGPTTPCSPPTSPDVYDPFDPTKSGTPSPAGPEASMDGPPSPPHTPADELQLDNVGGSAGRDSPLHSDVEDMLNKNADSRNKSPPMQTTEEAGEDPCGSPDRTKPITRETKSPVGISETISITPQLQNEELPQLSEITDVSKGTHGLPTTIASIAISEGSVKSPERKIGVVITTQPKLQNTPIKAPLFPIPTLKQVPTSQQSMTSTPSHGAPPPLFPSLTPVNIAMLCTPPANLGLGRTNLFSQPAPLSVPALLQHVTNAANAGQARLPSDKPPVSTGPIRLVQNGEPLAKPQDTTTEVVDMDLDSPYSPGSSEGDDLFDPPADTPSRSSQPAHPVERSKMGQTAGKGPSKLAGPSVNLASHKSPNKTQDKFDTLFGLPGIPTKTTGKSTRSKGHKGAKSKAKHAKGGRKEIAIKMDEDQLQILDELPSSAVELQVKDKFLKKLNRQERVVEEVKLSLKPHYNRKHITKEEYKDILRKSVPKICHNKSGEINPVKIATLVEAYVKKVRYEKKKSASSSSATNSTPAKGKVAKTTKWS